MEGDSAKDTAIGLHSSNPAICTTGLCNERQKRDGRYNERIAYEYIVDAMEKLDGLVSCNGWDKQNSHHVSPVARTCCRITVPNKQNRPKDSCRSIADESVLPVTAERNIVEGGTLGGRETEL